MNNLVLLVVGAMHYEDYVNYGGFRPLISVLSTQTEMIYIDGSLIMDAMWTIQE
jgi:hypothetical protein